jgi:hypothetical protein
VGVGPIDRVRPLAGGTQNVLVAFRFDGRDLVVRRTSNLVHKAPYSTWLPKNLLGKLKQLQQSKGN